MPHTVDTRYAVVSCHVERILDADAFALLLRLVTRRPGGLPIVALVRPPDKGAGEREDVWLERVQQLAAAGPLGHHTHWTSPTHARPREGTDPAGRVDREAQWLRERGVRPTSFCGGGWYTDASVAAGCATLGYVDLTPRARRPSYLAPGERWAELSAPARLETEAGLLTAVPTTHSIGDIVRALSRPGGLAEPVVSVYFHDTDLLDARRRLALVAALHVLGRRRIPSDPGRLAATITAGARIVPFADVARGENSGAQQ
jgi:hypothetical protein